MTKLILLNGFLGIKKDPYKTSQPNAKNIVTWQNNINSPQILKSLNDYLDFLGEEILTKMGYSYQELWQSLQTYHSDYRFFIVDYLAFRIYSK